MEKIVTLSSSVVCYRLICNRLPGELVKLIVLFVNPETDYYRDKIQETQKEHCITEKGFCEPQSSFIMAEHVLSEKMIANICRGIRDVLILYTKINNFQPCKATTSNNGRSWLESYRSHLVRDEIDKKDDDICRKYKYYDHTFNTMVLEEISAMKKSYRDQCVISEGEFIIVMILAGFSLKRTQMYTKVQIKRSHILYNPYYPGCTFNASHNNVFKGYSSKLKRKYQSL